MVDNTSKWGRATAAKRYASGGNVDDIYRDYMESNAPDPSIPGVKIDEAASAQRARNVAAQRVRNSRATPNSFPVGGEPKE